MEYRRCTVFKGTILQHYDDKVDIWSIGALLYKVIVGQCGFYAVSHSDSNRVRKIL